MTTETTSQPIGQPITLDDGRTVWIRVSPACARLEKLGHHWHRWAVDENGRRVGVASYATRSTATADAAVWVARAWRHAGLGRHLADMLTKAAEHRGIEWLTFSTSASDAAATRLLAEGGWIVARRVRGDHARIAVRLVPDRRPGVVTTTPRAA